MGNLSLPPLEQSKPSGPRLTETDVLRPSAAQFEAMFKVQGRLGSGSFGDVYRVASGGNVFALKVLRPGGTALPGGLLPEVAFFREARCMKHCRSRHVVGFDGLVRIPAGVSTVGDSRHSQWAILEEFMGEGTLQSTLYSQMAQRSHNYSNQQALTWAIEIASGLQALHTSSPMVIHRDLKSENIMFAASGGKTKTAKLGDFGLHVMLDRPAGTFLISAARGITTMSICGELCGEVTPPIPGSANPTPPASPPCSSCSPRALPQQCEVLQQQQPRSRVLNKQDSALGLRGEAGKGVLGAGSRVTTVTADSSPQISETSEGGGVADADGYLTTPTAAAVGGGLKEAEGVVDGQQQQHRDLHPRMDLISFKLRDQLLDCSGSRAEGEPQLAALGVQGRPAGPAADVADGEGMGSRERSLAAGPPSFRFNSAPAVLPCEEVPSHHSKSLPSLRGVGQPPGVDAEPQSSLLLLGSPSDPSSDPAGDLSATGDGGQESGSKLLPSPCLAPVAAAGQPYRRFSEPGQGQATAAAAKVLCGAQGGMVPLSTRTLRRMSMENTSASNSFVVPMRLQQGKAGMLRAVVPAGALPAGVGVGPGGENGGQSNGEGQQLAAAAAAGRIPRMTSMGETAIIEKYLEQANAHTDYEVNIPDCESVQSVIAYSRPSSVVEFPPSSSAAGSAAGGLVFTSAASDIWEDMNNGEGSCLDPEALNPGSGAASCWATELHYNMTGQTGSYMYMAPEMFKGLPYNEKVDIFSFGCILYELLSRILLLFNETPANHGSDCEVYAAKVAKGYRPSQPKVFPPAVWALVQKCWAQAPADRPSIGAVLQELQAIQEDWAQGKAGDQAGASGAAVGVSQGCGACVIS